MGWLWRFVKSWFVSAGPFSERARAIFKYWDGVSWKWIDPFEVQRSLDKHGGKNWMELWSGMSLGGGVELDKMSGPIRTAVFDSYKQSALNLANLVRLAFHIIPLRSDNGKPIGLSDTECLHLLTDFFVWLSALEEEFRPLFLLPTEEPQDPSEDWITEPSADSPDAGTESEPTSPMMSPEASQSPSQN